MNEKLYNAALTQLRGKALESLALIDILLSDPRAIPDHSSLVEEVTHHAKQLAEYEGAFLTLQQYFAPQKEVVRAPPPTPTPAPQAPREGPPLSEAEMLKRSPTMRKGKQARAAVGRKKKSDETKNE